jgi:hypothetical protein
MDRRKSSAAKKNKKGFAAKLADEIDDTDADGQSSGAPFQLPKDTEVAIFVAPGPRELLVVEKICRLVGEGTLVILLNARLATVQNFGSVAATELFTKTFVTVFQLGAAPQAAAPGCLLYCAYPGNWIVARKPTVGQPRTICVQSTMPTSAECLDAFARLELSDVERGVENVVDNLASWFR